MPRGFLPSARADSRDVSALLSEIGADADIRQLGEDPRRAQTVAGLRRPSSGGERRGRRRSGRYRRAPIDLSKHTRTTPVTFDCDQQAARRHNAVIPRTA
jgi:hypothetical protein